MSVSTAPTTTAAVVTASYRSLVSALKAAGLLAGGSRPMCPHVEVAVDGGEVTITAADTNTAVTVALPAAATGTGRVMVAWAELSKVLPAATKGHTKRQLDQLNLTLELDDQTLTVEVAGYRLPLAANGAQLPQIPNATPGTHVIDRDQFHAMFTRVAVAAGTDQLLPLFSHVHTELTSTGVTFTATDRYRLARGTIATNGTTTDTVLLPAPAMAKLLPLCDGDQIILGVDGDTADQWITMTSGTLTARIRNHHADYPRIGHLFNITTPHHATIDRAQLRDAADRAHALTAALSDRNTSAKITITPTDVTIAPGTRDNNATAPAIDADTDLDDTWHGAINPHYLRDAIAQHTADTVTIVFSGPGKPIKLTTDNDTYEHVVMLMRH